MNGLLHANRLLGEELFKLDDWKVIGEYIHDQDGGRHQAFYAPLRDIQCQGIVLKAGERIQVEQSLKFSADDTTHLWERAGLNEVTHWSASSAAYSKWSCRSLVLLFLATATNWE